MPTRRELSDLAAVRTLANPRRQKIMRHLSAHGPATSAQLARALSLNTGATSYHLRELARYGFIEEVPDRAHGRERWWQPVARDIRFPPRSRQSDDMRTALDEVTRLSFAEDVHALTQWLEQGSGEWADTVPYSRGTIRVTVDEMSAFFEEYIALVNKYARRDEQAPAGARAVAARLLLYPMAPDDTP